MKWGNLKMLLYLFILSLAACHPDRSINRELDVAGSIIEEEPDTALYILQQISSPSRLDQKEYARYCLLKTQAEEESRITHSSDSMIMIALNYFKNSSDSLSKAKAYYYMARVNEDMSKDSLATRNYLIALSVAERTREYEMVRKICESLAGLYKRVGLYDRAFEIQQKAYANNLLLEKAGRGNFLKVVAGSVLCAFILVFVVFFYFSRRNKKLESALSQSSRSLDELSRSESGYKLELVSLKKDLSILQKKYFENSEIITKIHAFNDRIISLKDKPGLTENEWNRFLGLLEETYQFISHLKKKAPRLTDDDIRICALLREGVTSLNISSVMSMSPETLARRIQRIKTDKLGLNETKKTLDSILKNF